MRVHGGDLRGVLLRTSPRRWALGLALATAGCQVGGATSVGIAQEDSAAASGSAAAVDAGVDRVTAVAFVEDRANDPQPAEAVPLPAATTQAGEQLDVEALVEQVLAINPDIRSAAAAWRAAAQRYPQQVALDDPMFGFMLGPGSWGNDEVEDAYTLEASQKIPWPGKRYIRGDIARAEANAAYFEAGEQRLRIAEATRLAFYQYFLSHRQLAVLSESTGLLQDFREIAVSRYEASAVEQQDVLLADLELAELKRRQLELTRQEGVARARINTLLLAPPDGALPAPPDTLPADETLIAADELRAIALAQRPDLAAQAARIRSERYAVELAYKEFYPDLEVVARYDAFWQEQPLRPMVGMNLNVPLNKRKRFAAASEARARVAKEQADFDAKTVEIAYEVEQTYRRVEESQQTLNVYRTSILPTARHSIDAARASYLAGRLDFLRLIESQRQLLSLQDEYYGAVAEYRQRLAELERLVGASPIAAAAGE
ncbi:MAG: TolC family protein [Pirellulales bacterium]|nr:TolC family protein [Pirellulales bacterium]